MYAVVGKWKMDPSQIADQDSVLHERIVPMVKGSPGFVSGQWTRTADAAEAISFIVFEDQGSAEAFLEVVKSDPENRGEHGVENGFLIVAEVLASA
jgi:heme-degrading monooxygenase HmoA